MVLVPKQKLQRMGAWRKLDARVSFASAVVQVVPVGGDLLVERRKIGIDQQMMVSGVGNVDALRTDPHAAQAHPHPELAAVNHGTVGRPDDVLLGTRRRR
jgi:hypothetical protein